MGEPPPPLKLRQAQYSETSFSYWRSRSTEFIIHSLQDERSRERLLVYPDGTVANGHHRLVILLERGVNINALRRWIERPRGWPL